MKQFFAPCLVLASMLGTTLAYAASMPVDTNARFKLGLNASIKRVIIPIKTHKTNGD